MSSVVGVVLSLYDALGVKFYLQAISVIIHGRLNYLAQASNGGASGYVLKRSGASELVAAIRAVLKEAFMSHRW